MTLVLTMQPTRDPLPRIAETPLDQLTFCLREIPDWHADPFKVRTETLTGDDAAAEWKYWSHVAQRRDLDLDQIKALGLNSAAHSAGMLEEHQRLHRADFDRLMQREWGV